MKCRMCKRSIHVANRKFPGLTMDCFACYKKGHMKNSLACMERIVMTKKSKGEKVLADGTASVKESVGWIWEKVNKASQENSEEKHVQV